MDIDARLDRLTERHEALTMTVELTAATVDSLAHKVESISEKVEIITEKLDILTGRTIQAMDAINRLARIAEAHESRISDLEEGK